MQVTAIFELKDEKEKMAGRLAAAMGMTQYEALSRLRVPGNGPVIVSISAELEPAVALAKRLEAEGFHALVLTAAEIQAEEGRLIVKRFELGEWELRIETTRKEKLAIAYSAVKVLLCGTAVSRNIAEETIKESKFSLSRAVLSGGLVMKKTTKTTREIITVERERFLNLYSSGNSAVAFRENYLAYDSLGPALKPSRNANFGYLITELRKLCPAVPYDDRLLNKAAQSALLGVRLDPERHLDVATALLAKALC
jgi:hypothetical protein